tara:strand:+ start:336 stop:629 length:294 start_codon:yes stop_codon:yes gene_type:complete
MKLSIKQRINVRRTPQSLGDRPIPLKELVNEHNFYGEILAIHGATIEVCKIDAKSLYGKGVDNEVYLIDTESGEYDVTPLHVAPVFQTEARTLHMDF